MYLCSGYNKASYYVEEADWKWMLQSMVIVTKIVAPRCKVTCYVAVYSVFKKDASSCVTSHYTVSWGEWYSRCWLQSKMVLVSKSNNSRVVKCDICYNVLYILQTSQTSSSESDTLEWSHYYTLYSVTISLTNSIKIQTFEAWYSWI